MPTVRAEAPAGSDLIPHGQFLPGTMLAGRYRVVSMIGKGGMGEVYRADDLELGQSVALKFLPTEFAADARRLEHFRREVRVARQIAHPNVCRVYDIAQAGGRQFLSMEYVDGEDLSAVLRRMGRPSKEKAVEISRQICAGLAAAHANEVLHRDLKPANVMIDGRGRVRITDFGLAGLADSFHPGEIRAGTPAYMAPEQLAGRDVSVRSDIYALGLVLFEIFTGRRLFDTNSVSDLKRMHDSGSHATPSSVVDDIDPAVERVIQQCLEEDPHRRPASVMAVAAALPGGDPLAAALAAGETPAPELVAAAGSSEGMHPAAAISCFLVIVGATLCLVPLARTKSLLRVSPLPRPPAALADRAAEILERLGQGGPVVDTAFGFNADRAYLEHVEKNDRSMSRWERLGSVRPSPIYFWYRQSPRVLVPADSRDYITEHDPPSRVAGTALVRVDPSGRLVRFEAAPPEREETTTASAPARVTDWSVLLAEAQIEPGGFSPAVPQWTPPVHCDERAAWEGHFPGQPDVPIRLEAGAWRGRPIYFRMVAPWTQPEGGGEHEPTTGEYVGQVLMFGLLALLLLGGVFMARRNLRLRRADRAGASRLAMACFCLLSTSWLLVIDHVPEFEGEFDRLRYQVALALLAAGIVWLWYVGLEPYVRRWWPRVLVSWTRLLGGRLRDPLVGRDILVGGMFGGGLAALNMVMRYLRAILEELPPPPLFWAWHELSGPRVQIGECLGSTFSVFFALLILFLFLGVRLLVKRQWLAVVVVLALNAFMGAAFAPADASRAVMCLGIVLNTAWMMVHLIVLLRFGLLASVFASFFTQICRVPAMLGLAGWQAGGSWIALIFLAALAGYGCVTAMAGRPLFKDELAEA
jgi:serine/threonine-protein kinase